MADANTIALAYDKPSYVKGDTMKLTMTGSVVRTTETTSTGSIDVTLTDGSKIHADAATITTTKTQDMAPTMTKVNDPAGRTWTVAADGKSATAVA